MKALISCTITVQLICPFVFINAKSRFPYEASQIFFERQNCLIQDTIIKLYCLFVSLFLGSLSAWFRSKYPYMVDGAVATSAPIHAQVDVKGII